MHLDKIDKIDRIDKKSSLICQGLVVHLLESPFREISMTSLVPENTIYIYSLWLSYGVYSISLWH
jgi:hypothetical protein